MVVGVGIDVAEVARIGALLAGHGSRFLTRCFRPAEQALVAGRERRGVAALAECWAAREAFLKALGTDIRRLPYRDVEVVRDPRGPVRLELHGRARAAMAACGGRSVHVSLSHLDDLAVAVVVIEG